eukprot:m.10133 g.10133  ORF g.10133 m.10133 type:complete len:468 (-) comp5133_c0_seq1:315-1718(-)
MGQEFSLADGSEVSHAGPVPSVPPPDRVDMRLQARFKELAGANPPFDTIHRNLIIAILGAPGAEDFGSRLYDSDQTHAGLVELDLPHYIHAIREALGVGAHGEATSVSSRTAFYFKVFSKGFAELSKDDARILTRTACALAIASGGPIGAAPPAIDSPLLEAILRAMFRYAKQPTEITLDEFCEFTSTEFPDMFIGAMKWIEIQGLAHCKDEEKTKSDVVWTILHSLPNLISAEGLEAGKGLLDYTTLWALTSALPDLYKVPDQWLMLYNSTTHGFSSNRFRHHVHNYDGPTVILFRLEKGALIGVCVDTEWKDKVKPWGGPNSRLFTVLPDFRMLHQNILVYENEKTRHVEHGIGFGADPSTAASALLWIQDDMQTLVMKYAPLANHAEPLTDRIRTVEVWGCGTSETALKQQRQRQRDLLAAEQKQKVKRLGTWEGEDRYLMELAGLNVDAQIDIRAEKKLALKK